MPHCSDSYCKVCFSEAACALDWREQAEFLFEFGVVREKRHHSQLRPGRRPHSGKIADNVDLAVARRLTASLSCASNNLPTLPVL